MDNQIKEAVDKLFEDALNGDDKSGRILVEISNECLKQTMRPSIPKYPMEKLRWK